MTKQLQYVDLYNQVNQSLSIKLPNDRVVNLVFTDLSNTNDELTDIYNKLNSIFQLDTDMNIFASYKGQLVQLSLSICNDINGKLTDGVLEPAEIVEFVTNSLNTVTLFITNQVQQQQDNHIDIKNLVMHYILSLMIIILSALEVAGIIQKDALKPTLEKINEVVTKIQLINQVVVTVAKMNSVNKCCTVS